MTAGILVTGGSGFIGSHIVERLAKTTEPKIVVYDVNAKEKVVGNVVNIRGDVFDSEKLLAAMQREEVSEVIHMVGLASIPACTKDPDRSFRLNVSSVHSILEAMRMNGAKRLVFPSTAAVYGDVAEPKVDEGLRPEPTSIYGCHKLAAETLIRGYAKDYGIDTTILRIFNVYGDFLTEQGVISTFIRRVMQRKPLIVNGGEQLRDFIHLNSVVDAFIRSLGNAAAYQKIINVGSGLGLSINQIAGMVCEVFPNTEVVYGTPQNGEYSIYADVSKMRNLLGCEAMDPRLHIPRFVRSCKREHAEGSASNG